MKKSKPMKMKMQKKAEGGAINQHKKLAMGMAVTGKKKGGSC